MERLAALRAGLWHQFNLCVELDDRVGMAPIAREIRQIDEMIAAQTGELRARAQAPVQHIHASLDFGKMRQALATALRPYPEALAAVSAALRTLDGHTPEPALIEARPA